MRKFLIGVLLVVCLSAQAWAVSGDSLSVAIRKAKDKIGTTSIPDSIWSSWANEGYQQVLTDGFAWLREALIYVKPYVVPDSDNYVLPVDCYKAMGATVITNGDEHDLKMVLPGQAFEVAIGRTGKIDLYEVLDDSIRFYPNPADYDTVVLKYYSCDGTIDDTAIMHIPKTYTPIIAEWIMSQYYDRMQNDALSDKHIQKFDYLLKQKTALRRDINADIVINRKTLER